MNSGLYMLIAMILGFLCLVGTGIFLDYKSFNHGICKKCGGKLRCFDNDSQGNRGYMCDKCKQVSCWVGYDFIDKN